MAKQVQRRRGTDTQHTGFTGAEGEISVNTTNKSVHVHDGATAGGFEAARADLNNVTGSSVLTKITAVDGSGSGLDADLLDGNEASSFATSAQGTLADSAIQPSDNVSELTNDAGYLTSFTETNDLSSAVTWANVPDANITQSSVTQHQAALSITESQVSDLQSYLTAETNDLSSVVTWANVPDANITQSSVTQHQAALTITESQISDLGPYDPAGTAVALAIALG